MQDLPPIERRFFGRRTSKALSNNKKTLIANSDHIFFDISGVSSPIDPLSLFPHMSDCEVILEIGFGGGEHLLHQATLNPHKAYIGCDAFITGQVRLLDQIHQNNIKNIRVVNADALHLLKIFQTHTIDNFYLLYPDPWPKRKHRKRRFIQKDTVILIRDLLKETGVFRFASDIEDYVDWVFTHIYQTNYFQPMDRQSYKTQHPDWISTRYEQKAFREGRSAYYFAFKKL